MSINVNPGQNYRIVHIGPESYRRQSIRRMKLSHEVRSTNSYLVMEDLLSIPFDVVEGSCLYVSTGLEGSEDQHEGH